MKERELRRTLSIFPIGSVMTLTDLTARQIRYYEDQGLILPERTQGNRRMYSLNDMDRLLEIKDYLSEGLTMAEIKDEYQKKADLSKTQKPLTDAEVRRLLQDDIRNQARFGLPSTQFGNVRL